MSVTVLLAADAEVAGDPTVAPAAVDGIEHLRSKPVWLGTLAGLTAEFLASHPGGREAGLHALAEQVTFELSDSGQHRGHHPSVRRVELERHAAHGDHGHLPAGKHVGEHQEPCGNCVEAGVFAFFLNGQFERIPKPGSTEDPPDCHTILGALEELDPRGLDRDRDLLSGIF